LQPKNKSGFDIKQIIKDIIDMDKKFLRDYFTKRQLAQDEISVILSNFKQVEFRKNDFLIKAGESSNDYWFLEQGFIRSYTFNTEGDDITTGFYSAGDIVIDWSSFLLRHLSREYIQATEDCVCWALDFETFQTLFHSIESFREQCRATLVESYFALKERTVSMITDNAKDRYEKLLKEKSDIFQHAPLKYIATYLGITDTSLSRIRKEVVSK
jgi:CRP-like cAMP-binding protein